MGRITDYRRLLFVIALSLTLVGAATGVAAACDTCADPDDDDPDRDALWSNDDFPYDTDENTSFAAIVINETEREMREDLGNLTDVTAAGSGAVGSNGSSASMGATASANGVDAAATAEADGGNGTAQAAVSLGLF